MNKMNGKKCQGPATEEWKIFIPRNQSKCFRDVDDDGDKCPNVYVWWLEYPVVGNFSGRSNRNLAVIFFSPMVQHPLVGLGLHDHQQLDT
jgi:hypothetical protein